MKQVVCIGGSGLIGSQLARHFLRQRAQVTIVDQVEPARLAGESSVGFWKADLFADDFFTNLFAQYQPDILVNTVNVATLCSQQPDGYQQLVGFYTDLYQALAARPQTALRYIQVGTTGSGGLGFDIPFTHGGSLEEQPIIHKAAFSGVTTSLLSMLSRSFPEGTVVVDEIKPGLAIFRDTPDEQTVFGVPLVTVDGGESGGYTYNELALLTSVMGFSTVQEVVGKIVTVLEERRRLRKLSEYSVTEALNTTIISANSRDQSARTKLLKVMRSKAEGSVVATGNLGPPSLCRDLLLADLVLSGAKPTGTEEVRQAMEARPGLRAALALIERDHADLSEYLAHACTHERFQQLQAQRHKSDQFAWQLVKKLTVHS